MDSTVLRLLVCLQILINILEQCGSLPTFWCPGGRYPAEDGRCALCYANCGPEGCSGPGSHLGPGGCSSCWLGLEVNRENVTCISPFSACPSGYYRKQTVTGDSVTTVCNTCHPLCRTCSGPGTSYCDTCRFFRWGGVCVRACPSGAIIRGRRRACAFFGGSSNRRQPFYLLPYRDRSYGRNA